MAGMFDSAFDTLNQEIIGGVPLWGFLVIVILGFIIFTLITKKEQTFKETDLKKEVRKDIKNYFDSYHERASKNTILMMGYKEIGLIKKISFMNWSTLGFNFKEKKTKAIAVITKEEYDKIKAQKPKLKDSKCYLFEVYTGRGLTRNIKSILGINTKYYVVEKEKVDQEGNIYNVDSSSRFSNFLDINVFSGEMRGLIEDISYKLTRENELKEMVDFARRAIYIQEKGASLGQKGEIIKEINKSNRNKPEGLTDNL